MLIVLGTWHTRKAGDRIGIALHKRESQLCTLDDSSAGAGARSRRHTRNGSHGHEELLPHRLVPRAGFDPLRNEGVPMHDDPPVRNPRAMIGIVFLALLVVAFVVFVIRQQVLLVSDRPTVSGALVAKWLLTGVVLLLLFVIGVMLKNPVHLLLTGERTHGVVVGMHTSPGGEAQDSLQSPIVEFVTGVGERVQTRSRTHASSPAARLGDVVPLVYDPASPRNAELLLWRELGPVAFLVGFIIIILMMWLSAILISGDHDLDDPLRILPLVISQYHLGPVRLPLLCILSLVIPACFIGAYSTTRQAIDLRNGITVRGSVTGSVRHTSRVNDGSLVSGTFPTIDYRDKTGTEHTIRRSLAKPFSRLVRGDQVEVVYRVRAPARGVVNVWDELYLPAIVFYFFLTCFLALLAGVLSGRIQLPGDGGNNNGPRILQTSRPVEATRAALVNVSSRSRKRRHRRG